MGTQAQQRRQSERDSTGQYTSYTPDESEVSLAVADIDPPGEDERLGTVDTPAGGWGRVNLTEGSSSPWGPIQTVTHYDDGIASVDTGSHRGVKLSAARNRAIPDSLRVRGGWYEEDCDSSIPMWHYPDEFADRHRDAEQVRESAAASLRNWYPDDYEQLTGLTATAENSVTRSKQAKQRSIREHRQAHSDQFVTLGSGSDRQFHKWAPEGYTVCEAQMDDTGEARHYLMPKSDVITNGMYGDHVVVDPDRHVDVSEVLSSAPERPFPYHDEPTEKVYGDDLGISTAGLSPAAGQRARRELSTTYRFVGEGEGDADVVETMEENISRNGLVGKQRMPSDSGGTNHMLTLGNSRVRPVSKATFDAVTGVEDHTSDETDARIEWEKADRRADRARQRAFDTDDGIEKMRRAESQRDQAYTTFKTVSKEWQEDAKAWQAERDEIRQQAWDDLVRREGLTFD